MNGRPIDGNVAVNNTITQKIEKLVVVRIQKSTKSRPTGSRLPNSMPNRQKMWPVFFLMRFLGRVLLTAKSSDLDLVTAVSERTRKPHNAKFVTEKKKKIRDHVKAAI